MGKRRGRTSEQVETPAEVGRLQARWTFGATMASHAASVTLWALVAVAAVAGTAAWLRPAVAPAVAAEAGPTVGEQAAVGEQATVAVAVWLGATRDDHAAAEKIFGSMTTTLPDVAPEVSGVRVAQLVEAGESVWSVTVGADVAWPVTDAAAEPEPPPVVSQTRLYFEVPVVVSTVGDQVTTRVVSLPAPVPAPTPASEPGLGYTGQVSAGSDLASTVAQFLTALLCGTGDVSRWTSPGVPVVAVEASPWSAVEVVSVSSATQVDTSQAPASGQRVDVLAAVRVTSPAGVMQAQYRLTMTGRDGRWEVSQVQGAPVRATSSSNASAPTEGEQ